MAWTNSLENNESPKKNDNIIITWKPMLMIIATRAIRFSDRYSGAVTLFTIEVYLFSIKNLSTSIPAIAPEPAATIAWR